MRAKDLTRSSIAYHQELNPAVWEGDELRVDVRYKLLEIAQRFIEYLEVPNFKLLDVVLRGSLANYNYTVYSDFDLHLITDFEALDCDIAEQYYLAKKTLWNDEHDINIKGHEVEAYVEDKDAATHSLGTYSILDNRWISKPKYNPPTVDEPAVANKVRILNSEINRAIRAGDLKELVRIKDKIKNMRKSGLEAGGEFSVENLAFKVLRNKKAMDKLYRAIGRAEDAELSIDEAIIRAQKGPWSLVESSKDVEILKSSLLDLTLARKPQVEPKLKNFIEYKKANPLGAFGSSDTSFTGKGILAGAVPKLRHAHLTQDLSVFYTLEGKAPIELKVYGVFSHEDSGTGDTPNKRRQKSLAQVLQQHPANKPLALDEASYPGNLGIMELVQLFRKCSPKQKRQLKLLLKKNDREGLRKFIKQILGVELHPLQEVRMSPKEFEKFAASPEAEGIQVGFEFELCVIGAGLPGEMDYDFENFDVPVYTSSHIYNFFTDSNSPNPTRGPDARVVANQLQSDYERWAMAKWQSYKKRVDFSEPQYKQRLLKYMDDHEYSTARDMLWDELEQDFYVSDNLRFQAYMEDMGTPMMSDIYRNWDSYLEWPWMSEDPAAGFDWIANQFTEDTGWPIRVSPGYHTASRESSFSLGKWIVEPDGSIEPKSADDAGLEFISPPMPLGEALEAVKKMRDWASDYAYTNTSTGLHINVSVPGLLRRNIDYVKLALFLGDNYLLELFKRTNNEYTRGSLQGIEKKLGWMADSALEQLRNTIRTGALKDAADNIQAAYTDKYNSINVKDGYVEFRSPGGDYLNSPIEDITRAVIRMAMALKIATDPQAYREEYQKKFYKLIAPKPVRKEFPETSDLLQMYIYGDARQRAFAMGKLREKLASQKQGQQGNKEWWVIDNLSSPYPLMKFFAATEEEARQRLEKFRTDTRRVGPLWVKPAGWTVDSPRSPEQSWVRTQ